MTQPATWPPGTLVADYPRTVTRSVRCAVWDRMCRPGERVATLASGAGTAHLDPCITQMTPADFGPRDD